MKVLIDTNVALDVLLNREPWVGESQKVWQACEEGRITGYLLASTLTDIFYIARKLVGNDKARQAVELCLATFAICPINKVTLEEAVALAEPDFEDNVLIVAAVQTGLEAIVTRNPGDFAHSPVTVLAPEQLLEQFDQAQNL